ncbi:hypothetical protein [Amycolatopsis sp. cmx-11-12]
MARGSAGIGILGAVDLIGGDADGLIDNTPRGMQASPELRRRCRL